MRLPYSASRPHVTSGGAPYFTHADIVSTRVCKLHAEYTQLTLCKTYDTILVVETIVPARQHQKSIALQPHTRLLTINSRTCKHS